ncbi:MAU2 chromatid cohesion factor homolog [Malurus melanocephalus]|uniref:MAU2 chromatid cohesion factor homolog n=1 Tax=Malurus melanocephalus TaxID=175006 RepID=UPI00254741B7|nr:MAU2 chromatid cohesion factor homolog [Malurus melanocephalus]
MNGDGSRAPGAAPLRETRGERNRGAPDRPGTAPARLPQPRGGQAEPGDGSERGGAGRSGAGAQQGRAEAAEREQPRPGRTWRIPVVVHFGAPVPACPAPGAPHRGRAAARASGRCSAPGGPPRRSPRSSRRTEPRSRHGRDTPLRRLRRYGRSPARPAARGRQSSRALFLLSKGMLLLMERKLQEVHPLLTLCGQIVENWQGNPIQKESLRVFFLVLQVTHYLDAGQVKSVKPCLKQLQQCIQTISTLHDDEILPSNPADLFHWLPKEHMCVLVYLGLYCISVNCMDNAEAQFTTALRLTTHQELWAFIVTNLASVYIREGNRHQELYSLLERINPDHNFPVSSHCLRAAAFYIRGLFSFFQGRYNEAKRFLRETLKMSNAEDLNRLTACSLVLLGHIFYVLGNHRESNNMVVPAMQLASKIPDMSVQLWSSALLRDLNKACGNAMDAHEAAQMHQNFSQQLLQDHIEACSLPEHNLITWTDGPPPVQFQAQNGPTTSLASLL